MGVKAACRRAELDRPSCFENQRKGGSQTFHPPPLPESPRHIAGNLYLFHLKYRQFLGPLKLNASHCSG